MLFEQITSIIGIMTLGYGIGRLIEFLIKRSKKDGE